jgi:hypothetical protein
MDHAPLSIASPIHLVQPCVFPMPSSMPAEAPIELSPPMGANNNGKCTITAAQNEDVGDWNLDQFPLPFPTPELTQDDQPNGESSAFVSGTSQSSGKLSTTQIISFNISAISNCFSLN